MAEYKAYEVCKLLGIGKSTLFRWEKENIFPLPKRTLEGHRIYSNRDIEIILARLTVRQTRIAKASLRTAIETHLNEASVLTRLLSSF